MNDSIHQVLAELIGNGVGQFKAAVPVAWTVPAVVMILWTGLKIGRFPEVRRLGDPPACGCPGSCPDDACVLLALMNPYT